jgi:hypothetical protein
MKALEAHLRRSLQFLAWIDGNHPGSRVSCGTLELGIWRDLQPRWHLENGIIRLIFSGSGPNPGYRAKCVLPAAWGARIPIITALGARELAICWHKAGEMLQPLNHGLAGILQWTRNRWPGCRVVAACRRSDRSHTLSGSYYRIRIRYANEDQFVLACASDLLDEVVHSILTQALLWVTHLNIRKMLNRKPGIHLLVPADHSTVVIHRSRLLNTGRVEVSVWNCERSETGELRICRPGALPAPLENRDYRWPVLGPFRWSPLLARVLDLAPDAIQRYPRFQDYDSLRLNGLEFARALGPERDRIVFGVGGCQTELTEENFEELRRLVGEILYYRRPDSPASDHPYYRIQAERWLECQLLSEVEFLFPELIPGSVYPQIPLYLGKTPGRADILGADLTGNLVVMELKVSEDPDMPLQALDYWGRVREHNWNGDFERRGYFSGIRLSRARPRLYLVAPIFSFHDSLERLLGCLEPDLEVNKIAVNEDWRCGIRILHRTKFRCGDLQ